MKEKNWEMTAGGRNELLSVLLELGEEMYGAGAEINRVEDTLSRIGSAYGTQRMNVFAITSTIVVTMSFKDVSITQSRRIQNSGQTDFSKLEAYNALSRKCCLETPEPLELKKEIEIIRAGKPAPLKTEAGSVLASGAFAVFFGGTLWDGLAAAALGFLISRISGHIGLRKPNRIIYNFLMSLITGTAAIVLCSLIPILCLLSGGFRIVPFCGNPGSRLKSTGHAFSDLYADPTGAGEFTLLYHVQYCCRKYRCDEKLRIRDRPLCPRDCLRDLRCHRGSLYKKNTITYMYIQRDGGAIEHRTGREKLSFF